VQREELKDRSFRIHSSQFRKGLFVECDISSHEKVVDIKRRSRSKKN
jgi:hypothetical protein